MKNIGDRLEAENNGEPYQLKLHPPWKFKVGGEFTISEERRRGAVSRCGHSIARQIYKILLIEDHKMQPNVLGADFRSHGCRIHTADSVKMAEKIK